MEDKLVLITTSGLGSRLGDLTKYTNKCLVRIGDKPAISHIIESYPKETRFVITIGYYGKHVKQFLELAYPRRKIDFVEIDKFQGPGSSLGYSISKCRDLLKEPFIFHASDTIIKENFFPYTKEYNWIACSKTDNSSHYRTVSKNGDFVSVINEKGELNYDAAYVGICGIRDYELFFETLDLLLKKYPDKDVSDAHVINLVLEKERVKYFEIEDWFDIGNASELKRTREHFRSNFDVLDKNEESIFFFEKEVIKFFSDQVINENRVKRSKILGSSVPLVTGWSSNFYKYQKAKGDVFSKSVNIDKFKSFLSWSRKNLWIHKVKSVSFEKNCFDFYKTKTENRISKFLDGSKDKSEVINGIIIPPIQEILKKIDFENWLSKGIPTNFHGDFILENVIENEGNFKLIDWRQDFQGNLETGDLYYDLAKLNHNLIFSHDLVSKGLFSLDEGGDCKKCEILVSSKMLECRDYLHNFIEKEGWDLKKVKILTPLIWINMSPLHEYPLNKFLFTFGKYNLYKEINEM